MTIHHDKNSCVFYHSSMIEETTSPKTYSITNENDNARSLALQLTKGIVPITHKNIANNYYVIKKIFKFQACHSRISNVEKATLNKYDFNTLENTTMQQMQKEIKLLQEMAINGNVEQQNLSELILSIRVKELKFLEASCYATVSNEIYTGYKVLENYLKEISKYKNTQYDSVNKF